MASRGAALKAWLKLAIQCWRCWSLLPTSASSERYTRTSNAASSAGLLPASNRRSPAAMRDTVDSLTPTTRARAAFVRPSRPAARNVALVRTAAAASGRGRAAVALGMAGRFGKNTSKFLLWQAVVEDLARALPPRVGLETTARAHSTDILDA